MELPAAFCRRMERLLGADYKRFFESYEKPLRRGVRVNLLKTDKERFLSLFPLPLVPSPFAAALLLGLNRPPEVFSLLGMTLSLALRLLWGVESDPWQYAGLFFLWLLLRRLRPRPGIETAALGGAAMMPRAIQSLFTGEPLTMLLSLAAVPVCMAISAWFRAQRTPT